jgi:hypothetical protein
MNKGCVGLNRRTATSGRFFCTGYFNKSARINSPPRALMSSESTSVCTLMTGTSAGGASPVTAGAAVPLGAAGAEEDEAEGNSGKVLLEDAALPVAPSAVSACAATGGGGFGA